MSNVYDNILKRCSVRKFTDEAISEDNLKKILDAGIHAPSGMNRQTWQFTVLRKRSDIQEFASVIRDVLGRDAGYNMYNPDVLVIASNVNDSPWGEVDCACALENMFLMAADLSIGSCWINQANTCCNNPLVRSLLNKYGVPQNHNVYGMAALGYPCGTFIAKYKNPAVIHFAD